MAKNYTFAEAVKIINEGTDLEALVDIGRRYPVLMHKVTQVCVLAGEEFVELMGFMPEYLTANKVNTAIKAMLSGESTGDDAGSEDEGDDSGESTGDEAKDYESMSAKQLWDILGKAGKRKLAKSTKKADLVAACKAMDAGEEPEDEEDGDEAKETKSKKESDNPYDGKTAVELFKECKKRGIKAEIKKPAKYYADLLVKDDASKDAGDDDDGDRDDDEAKTGKDAKSEKKEKADTKKEKAGAKKDSKKEEDDDEDNWDI